MKPGGLLNALLAISTLASRDGPATIPHPVSSSVLDSFSNAYIVVFGKDATDIDVASHLEWVDQIHLPVGRKLSKTELRKRSEVQDGGDHFQGVKHTYDIGGTFRGYFGHFDKHILEQISHHPYVRSPFQNSLAEYYSKWRQQC